MDEEYSKEIANYIFSIFRTNPFVVMSWGINPASITIVEVGVKFHVQGFIHTGYVQVVLNEGEDLFEVTLISEDGETNVKITRNAFLKNMALSQKLKNERKWDFPGNFGGPTILEQY